MHPIRVEAIDPIGQRGIRRNAEAGTRDFIITMLSFLNPRKVEKGDVCPSSAHIIGEIQVIGSHIVLIDSLLDKMQAQNTAHKMKNPW